VLPVEKEPTLNDIGISKMQSSRWQGEMLGEMEKNRGH